MKETIIIEENSKRSKLQTIIEWLIHMILYAVVLVTIALLFPNTVYIDKSMFGLWALLTAILVSILNQTIKPILFWLTLPITGMTLGLFYPFINLIILKLVSVITVGHFEIHGIFFALLVSIIISGLNIIMDKVFAKVMRKER